MKRIFLKFSLDASLDESLVPYVKLTYTMWYVWLQIFIARIYDSLVHIRTIEFQENRIVICYIRKKFSTGTGNARKWNGRLERVGVKRKSHLRSFVVPCSTHRIFCGSFALSFVYKNLTYIFEFRIPRIQTLNGMLHSSYTGIRNPNCWKSFTLVRVRITLSVFHSNYGVRGLLPFIFRLMKIWLTPLC